MPEEPAPAPSPSPFSFGSAPPAIGISKASSFLRSSLTAAVPPSKSPEVLLKIKCQQFGRPEHSMQVALDSPVAAIVARLRTELDAGDELSAPMTLFYCGKVLSCATQPLVDVAGLSPPTASEGAAAMRTLSMSCLRKLVTQTPPTPPVSLTPQAAAAAAAAARATAAAAAAATQSAAAASRASATDAAPAAEEPLRVRPITGRAVLRVPLAAGMTAVGLKQELQRRGEGPVEQFRLLHAGKAHGRNVSCGRAYRLRLAAPSHVRTAAAWTPEQSFDRLGPAVKPWCPSGALLTRWLVPLPFPAQTRSWSTNCRSTCRRS